MIILTGSTLGERQRELNAKVKEAKSKMVNFNDIRDTAEESDVDRLFKIDLASKYLNIDYIIEVLKSGDSLYISRALKCSWIYGDSYSHIINVDNLHNNVIPFMSNKMKKKLLTAISTHVRDNVRAAEFYKYCMDSKLTAIALKFLNFTNDTFKLLVLNEQRNCNRLIFESEGEYLKNFIGLSYTLAEEYVKVFGGYNKTPVFRELSYLYTVSEEKYLDLLEKYFEVSIHNNTRLGLRISKSIMKRHKDRVLKKPSVYVCILSQSSLARYSTTEDAKIYAAAVLPDNVEDFWSPNYCDKYKFLLDKITVGKFQYIKQIFTAKYPEESFETNPSFYYSQNYKIMTIEEQETWALQQIASENEILGNDEHYLWYKFVNFEKAFEEIKKLVLITTDNTKRADMLLVLVNSAKTQRDVEKLLKHFYARHVNEQKFIKENFIDRVMQNFNVFEFDEDCWTAFNKMFYNLEVYNITNYNSKTEYRIVALLYCIINQKEVPEAIRKQLHSNIQFYTLKQKTNQLTKEQQQMVFSYLFKFYMDEIRKYENVPYEDEVKYHLRKYIHFTLDLLYQYDKTKEDCPELVNKFMKLDWSEFEHHRLLRDQSTKEITRADLLRDLKKDSKLLVEHLPLVKTSIRNSYRYDISMVLRKLKIYFSNDIAKDYLKLFETLLSEDQLCHRVSEAATHGIFQLADEKVKVDFMAKFAPKDSKINHSEIDEKFLRIQEAICAHVCYSRPPVPLKSVLMYIKGDYVHFCLPIFHSYLANLPLPLCMEFIEAISDAPVSIQKHGLRLAFECFNAENINTLVLRAWKNTKNVSLRIIIFKAMFNKISKVTNGQDLLFDTLKVLTLSLRPEDDDEIFSLLIRPKLPEHLTLEYIEMAWKVVSQFPPKPANLTRQRKILMFICNKIDTIRQEFIRSVIESFIATVFIQEENVRKLSSEASDLNDAKWQLTATYIINVQGNDDLGKKMDFTKQILKTCLKDIGIREKKRDLLKICFFIIRELENTSYYQDFNRYENVNKIMQLVLDTLEETLPIEEIYMEVWEIRLGIVARKVIADSKTKSTDQEQIDRGVIKKISNNFANELGILMKEFVEKEMFFATFSSDIQDKITNKTQTLKNLIDSKTEFTDMMTNICLGLMSFKVTEIYLLVINLLPDSCRCEYEEEFKTVIKQLTKMDNKEIRCNLFRKLANPNFDGCDFM